MLRKEIFWGGRGNMLEKGDMKERRKVIGRGNDYERESR